MRIAQLAPLAESVPPIGYGGTELIVSHLSEDLVARGHEVTLFASGDSKTKANLVSVTAKALRSDANVPIRRWQTYDIRLLLELEKRQDEFDIVHNHMGHQALPFLKRLRCANVTTNHNNVKDYCADVYLAHKDLPYVAISKSYKSLNYATELNYVDIIYNGIDVERFPYNLQVKRSGLLFIGRVCKDKGTADAIKIARRLGIELTIAGKVDDADSDYFAEEVKPHLNGSVKYIGEVNFMEKAALYNKALAVIYPVAFNEPFGLVMAESLLLGTPVVAFDRGAVQELIVDGETGVVGKTVDELVDRFGEVEKMSRAVCRERAIKLFSKERMLDEYESLYQQICCKDVLQLST